MGYLTQITYARNGDPVRSQQEADEAARNFGSPSPAVADEPEFGLWLVDLPLDASRQLEKYGRIEMRAGQYTIEAEMP